MNIEEGVVWRNRRHHTPHKGQSNGTCLPEGTGTGVPADRRYWAYSILGPPPVPWAFNPEGDPKAVRSPYQLLYYEPVSYLILSNVA